MPAPAPLPAYPFADQRHLNSIIRRTTGLAGHLAGARVFVAGSHGFFGKWFMATLIAWRESGLDLIVEGASVRDGFDICQPHTYPGAIEDADYVINCAGGYQEITDDETIAVHTYGPQTLRSEMRRDAILLQLSSGAARDAATVLGFAKREAEATLPPPTQIVRPFTTVGPGMDLNAPFAISAFIRASLAGQPLEVPPRPVVRSFSHIEDTVVQSLHVMCLGDGKPYDVGSEDRMFVEDAARLLSTDVRKVERPFASYAGADLFVPDTRRVRDQFNLDCKWRGVDAIMDAYHWARMERERAQGQDAQAEVVS